LEVEVFRDFESLKGFRDLEVSGIREFERISRLGGFWNPRA
jgi:hypothetical protein